MVQVTPSEEETAARLAQVREQLESMTPEQRTQRGDRLERQIQQLQEGRAIPLHRVMKKADIPGVLVTPFNVYEPNRYYR